MDMKDLQPSYTMRDMVKMFRRVDELTRANNVLTKQLEAVKAELEHVKSENADLTAQLDGLQEDFARQMTAPHVLSKSGQYDA